MTEKQSGAAEVPNNPAGRVLWFLKSCREMRYGDAESAIGTILEVEPGSSDMYLRLVRLRIQAESVPDLVAPYATELKFGSFFRHYPEIIDAMKRCQFPAKKPHVEIESGRVQVVHCF